MKRQNAMVVRRNKPTHQSTVCETRHVVLPRLPGCGLSHWSGLRRHRLHILPDVSIPPRGSRMAATVVHCRMGPCEGAPVLRRGRSRARDGDPQCLHSPRCSAIDTVACWEASVRMHASLQAC